MILVNCALRHDDIIKIVEGLEVDGTNPFKFKSKQGLQMFFESTYGDDEKAASFVKSQIKSTEVGKALFFSVAVK
ncbi:hypothetical protein [Clostridium sp.]|uniref:hypothetical protein n=1 Tax=Clostridium sp. TaxID=1506 RepID=UPI0029074319|nr:hypothetical protein [Clostridium sp.]MDU6541314.1 hypothetical protein [Clostridium sp.]